MCLGDQCFHTALCKNLIRSFSEYNGNGIFINLLCLYIITVDRYIDICAVPLSVMHSSIAIVLVLV